MNIVLTYLALVVLLLMETIVFMWQRDLLANDAETMTQEIWLSLAAILRISAYVIALPLALRVVYTWISGNWHNILTRVYLDIAATAAFVLWLCNLVLYGYKECKIDASMVSQLLTNPGESLASISFLNGAAVLILLGIMVFCMHWMAGKLFPSKKHDPVIFIPIRPSAAIRAMHSVFIILVGTGIFYLLDGGLPSLPTIKLEFATTKAEEQEQDVVEEVNVEEALKELYAMPHTLGLDNEEAYKHPRPQMITDKRPNIIIILLPGLNSTNCKVLNAEADASLMPFTNKMYDNGIGFTRLYANNADLTVGLPNLDKLTKVLKDNGYALEEFSKDEDDQKLLDSAYNSIEEGRKEGVGKTGNPFVKVVRTSTSKDSNVTYTDACLKSFIGRLWYTPTWRNTLIVALGEVGAPKEAKKLDDAEYYHVPMFWTGGVLSAHGHVDIICQQSDLAATILGQMGIDCTNLHLSNNIFDRVVPHFAFFMHKESFGFLTDSISYVQDVEGKALPATNDPEGKAKKWGQACLRSYAAYKTE